MVRRKHYSEPSLAYHLTTRTLDGAFHLESPRDKWVILRALQFYRRRGDCMLFGFIIMDNHAHVVLSLQRGIDLSAFADELKTWTSRHNRAKPQGSHLWERRYDDNAVRDQRELLNVLDYVHKNAVRAGLVKKPEEYPWSSIHNYLRDGRELIEIDIDWIL